MMNASNTITGHQRRDCSIIRKLILFVIVGLCTCMTGCDPGTTWSAKVPSPDGSWIATARTLQWGGPGTAYDATEVFLEWNPSTPPPFIPIKPPLKIIGFSHDYGRIYLKMEWITNKHLEVTYAPSDKPQDHVTLDFQAIKCGDVEISVKELPPQKIIQ